jgi:hypothetical protein
MTPLSLPSTAVTNLNVALLQHSQPLYLSQPMQLQTLILRMITDYLCKQY